LLDPLAKSNGLHPEIIPITALVIETNKGSMYFRTGLNWIPQAVFDDKLVYDDTRDFAEALAKQLSDPYGYMKAQADARQDTSPRPY
jgi:hypothetical protein